MKVRDEPVQPGRDSGYVLIHILFRKRDNDFIVVSIGSWMVTVPPVLEKRFPGSECVQLRRAYNCEYALQVGGVMSRYVIL